MPGAVAFTAGRYLAAIATVQPRGLDPRPTQRRLDRAGGAGPRQPAILCTTYVSLLLLFIFPSPLMPKHRFCNLSLVGVVLVRTLGHTNTIAPGPGSNSIPDPESTPGPLDLEKVPPPILPVWPRDERRMQTLESRISDFCDVSAVAGDESAAVEMVVLDDDTVYAVSVASMSVNGGSRWRDSCMSCAETLVSPVSPVVPAMPPAYRSLMGGAGGRAYSAV